MAGSNNDEAAIRVRNLRVNAARVSLQAACHAREPRAHAVSGSSAHSAASNAIDMPFPVNGGIIRSESPIHSSPALAGCRPVSNPAPAENDPARISAPRRIRARS